MYVPRKRGSAKRVSLNLNDYMHIHPQTINQARKIYFDRMFTQMKGVKFGKVDIDLVLFKGSRRKIDRANFLSIVEKFFCDALVIHGCIEDDNDDFILSTRYSTGGVDKEDPRVEITVTERSK